jgi:tungstate transport system ATP-binding protein
MTTGLRLAQVEKRYGARVALQLDELTIAGGRLHALTGPNGSGKSTLLNVLALLLRPERGRMWLGEEEVTWRAAQLQALRRRVTLMQQSPYLFSGTVAANLAFGLKARRQNGGHIQAAISRALETVRLAGFERRNVRELSGGEARRVALARALVLEPEVLLLDEPLANLDEESTGIIERLIAGLPAQGTTVVMATHDLEQARRLATDVIRLMDGCAWPETFAGLGQEPNFDKVEQCPRTNKQDESSSTTPLPSAASGWRYSTP